MLRRNVPSLFTLKAKPVVRKQKAWVRNLTSEPLFAMKALFLAIFFGGNISLAAVALLYKPEKYQDKFDESQRVGDAMGEFATKGKDSERPPWPLLHLHVTEMREGKRNYDDIQKIWDQVKYYHSGDWLIPIEITQILKYTTAKFMSTYVREPEQFRFEVLHQLEAVKYGQVATVDPITRDVQDIINTAINELKEMSLRQTDEIPLVPTHTK